MKRRWIGLIILLAVGMSIIGVSKQQRPVQSEDESITLRVVLWDYDVVIYDRELIENFEKDHPDIKIDVISYPRISESVTGYRCWTAEKQWMLFM